MKVLGILYGHPEAHSALVSSIISIADNSSYFDFYYRNNFPINFYFPTNVNFIPNHERHLLEAIIIASSKYFKFVYFLKFAYKLIKLRHAGIYDLIFVIDPIALSSLCISNLFCKKKCKIWYHNYDPIYSPKNHSFFSITYISFYLNKLFFDKIDYFTLPMQERLIYFPVEKFKIGFGIIPNYPNLRLHTSKLHSISNDVIKIVFVGSIGPGRGLEEIIDILNQKICNNTIQLHVKGYLDEDYKCLLMERAFRNNAIDNLFIYQFGAWDEVPLLIKNCDIGLAFYDRNSTMTSTLGLGGSTKIFQYIGESLPVLVDAEFKTNYLPDCTWAIGVNLNSESILDSISFIFQNYAECSQAALNDFKEKFNCNQFYNNAFKYLFQSEGK